MSDPNFPSTDQNSLDVFILSYSWLSNFFIKECVFRAKRNVLQFLVLHACTINFYNYSFEYSLFSQFFSHLIS